MRHLTLTEAERRPQCAASFDLQKMDDATSEIQIEETVAASTRLRLLTCPTMSVDQNMLMLKIEAIKDDGWFIQTGSHMK